MHRLCRILVVALELQAGCLNKTECFLQSVGSLFKGRNVLVPAVEGVDVCRNTPRDLNPQRYNGTGQTGHRERVCHDQEEQITALPLAVVKVTGKDVNRKPPANLGWDTLVESVVQLNKPGVVKSSRELRGQKMTGKKKFAGL